MKTDLLFFLGLTLGIGLGTTAFADPNLVPDFNATNGAIKVANVGADPAGASWVTVNCQAQGGGSCPDPTPAQAAPYENPPFFNKVSVKVPALGAGQPFMHPIAFFNALNFAPGTYVFTVCVDAGAHVVETNERDNCARFVKRVRGRPTGPGGFRSNSLTN